MAYSGRYLVENKSKYAGDPTNVIFRSLWERDVFKWLDMNPKVKSWCSEEVVVPYFYEVDKRYHRYYPDIKIVFEDKTILVEIKPAKETEPPKNPNKSKRYINESLTYIKNMNKWQAADDYCKDRGWQFQIWTENTLYSMGIMTKPLKKVPGKLKPLKPYRHKKRKK